MIPLILIDANVERRLALERFLTGTRSYRVQSLSPADITLPLSRTGDPGVLLVMHEEGQDGLLLVKNLRKEDADRPVMVISPTYDPQIARDVLQNRAEYVIMHEPAATSYPVLQLAIDRAVDVQRLRERGERMNKKLTLVGSDTRHDVLNQLTVLNGYTELLGMMIEDPKMKAFLEKEQLAIEKIRRQFQFAKDYQNLGTESPRWQSISSAVRSAAENLDSKGVKVTESCGNALIFADPFFEKAVFQLLDNAVRHGGATTEVRISLTDQDGGAVLVVGDNGNGIPSGDKEKIFERGFGRRTGWGLFLVREILAITGITVAETGEPGRGARFEIHIPKDAFRRDGGGIPSVQVN
jgi:signal transduction histidine kinase